MCIGCDFVTYNQATSWLSDLVTAKGDHIDKTKAFMYTLPGHGASEYLLFLPEPRGQ